MTQTPALPGSPDPISMTARRPEDLLAMAPVLLGFWPEESVVMLTFGASRPFHARSDLPPLADQDPALLGDLDELFLGPARQHGARAVVLLYFTADPAAAGAVHAALEAGCRASGIDVIAGLVADGHRHRVVGEPGPGTPYDVSCHPFVVAAIVSGRLAHRNRAELVASIAPDRVAVEGVVAALLRERVVDEGPPADGRTIREQGLWLRGRVAEGIGGLVPSDEDAGRMLWVMQTARVRDAAWTMIRRRTAAAHAELWTGVLRRSPDELAAAPAALLGWAAWQAGDGARAWAAVDRCEAVEPGYPLAEYLAVMLQHAVPPDFWEEDVDWTLGLPAVG